ncbi:hypothetical protein E2C01_064981 [Portunus trituberculatus]|uniref:Uncharacterized protein n=1 Tax=Portunus trituberculatus TaxID=210409 RepID=A0A5B7HNE9_PORTR|nr:hypothetical protein [Portunus trituberculatus]
MTDSSSCFYSCFYFNLTRSSSSPGLGETINPTTFILDSSSILFAPNTASKTLPPPYATPPSPLPSSKTPPSPITQGHAALNLAATSGKAVTENLWCSVNIHRAASRPVCFPRGVESIAADCEGLTTTLFLSANTYCRALIRPSAMPLPAAAVSPASNPHVANNHQPANSQPSRPNYQ